MEIINYVYISILSLCAIFSVIKENSRREKLWIYFSLVLISEFYTIFFKTKFYAEIYLYSSLIYNIFLIYYFLKNTSFWRYLYVIYVLVTAFIIINSDLYSQLDSLSIILLYLFLSLYYYFSQIISVDEIPIQKKQKFWIATGLFIWSIAYAFNAIPIFFLANNDMTFFVLINDIFRYVTILSYLLFLVGLNCKYL